MAMKMAGSLNFVLLAVKILEAGGKLTCARGLHDFLGQAPG